jgi:hypothetical protein
MFGLVALAAVLGVQPPRDHSVQRRSTLADAFHLWSRSCCGYYASSPEGDNEHELCMPLLHGAGSSTRSVRPCRSSYRSCGALCLVPTLDRLFELPDTA